jgi:hypothetical protein
MSNPTLKILPALIVAITAALAQPADAAVVPPQDIAIDEFSSTSLTVSFNGSTSGITVQNTSADHWTVTFDSALGFTFNSTPMAWAEPENSTLDPTGLWNQVTFVNNAGDNQMFIVSDTSLLSGSLFAPNGSFVPVGSVSNSFIGVHPLNAGFTDHSDVPDSGTSASLLGLSLAGLAFVRRKVCH